MARTRTINTHCHGCSTPMSFPAVPVRIVQLDGTVRHYHGKDSAVWICKTCRQVPAKLKAARLAAGMPADASREGFDADE
jgi:hypothetical protein